MRNVLAFLLCITIPVAVFAVDAQNGYTVTYDGGSLSDTKTGAGLKLFIDGTNVRFAKDKTEIANIPASAITEISKFSEGYALLEFSRCTRIHLYNNVHLFALFQLCFLTVFVGYGAVDANLSV